MTRTFCLDVGHIHHQHDDLNFSYLGLFWFCNSKNWYVWVGTCSCTLILGHDKQKQPSGIFIFAAVWGKRQPQFRRKKGERYWQVTAKIKETPASILIRFLTAARSFNVPRHGFYKFLKHINTKILSRENPVSSFVCNFGICCFHCHTWMRKLSWEVVMTPPIASISHCFHFHPPFQLPLMACRDNIIQRRFHLRTETLHHTVLTAITQNCFVFFGIYVAH